MDLKSTWLLFLVPFVLAPVLVPAAVVRYQRRRQRGDGRPPGGASLSPGAGGDGWRGKRAAEEALLAALSRIPQPGADAARCMLRTAFPAVLLLARLRRGPVPARARAMRLLVSHPAGAWVEALLQSIPALHRSLRDEAVGMLARLPEQDLARPLLRALSAPDRRAQATAAAVLAARGPTHAGVLRAGLADPDPAIRCQAIERLLQAACGDDALKIAHLLDDPDEGVRARAAWALGQLAATGETADALVEAFNDPSPRVQEAVGDACIAVGGGVLDSLLLAVDRRATEDLQFRLPGALPDALARALEVPSANLLMAISGPNGAVTSALVRALDGTGVLRAWLERFPEMSRVDRAATQAVLRAAARHGFAAAVLAGLSALGPEQQQACADIAGEVGLSAALPQLAGLLSTPHEHVRRSAIEALRCINGEEALALLVRALADPSPWLRAAAAAGLGAAAIAPSAATVPEEGCGRVLEALLQALGDPAAEVRKSAAQALAGARTEAATDALLEVALRDGDREVRDAALDGLQRAGACDALPVLLLGALGSAEPAVRAEAVAILGRIGDPTAFTTLVGALQDLDADVRAAAGRGVWDAAEADQAVALMDYLNSPDPRVRAAIAGVLGKTCQKDAAGRLAAAAPDPNPRVRAAVVKALGRLGEAVLPYQEAVLARLTDTDAFVRARAVEAAFQTAPSSAAVSAMLRDMSTDPDVGVQEAVTSCVLTLAGAGEVEAILRLLGGGSIPPPIFDALRAAEDTFLWHLFTQRSQTPPTEREPIPPPLAEVLRLRWRAADIKPFLISLNTGERVTGLEALALLEGPEARDELARVLSDDPVPAVRLCAVVALGARTGDPVAQAALRQAAGTDPDVTVQEASARALGEPMTDQAWCSAGETWQ